MPANGRWDLIRRLKVNSLLNKDELSLEWKESIIVQIYKRCDKTDCSNNRGVLHLSTTYNNSFNILFSTLSPHAEEITVNHQCAFQRNR